MGLLGKIGEGLGKTRRQMSGAIEALLHGKSEVDDDFFDGLEEALILADTGISAATELVEGLRKRGRKLKTAQDVREALIADVAAMLTGGEEVDFVTRPSVVLMIGVNGAGKTTNLGKLCAYWHAQDKKVILAAADTFRAAAVEQLDVWAKRTNTPIIRHKEGADPAAVIYDAIAAAKARDIDIVLCDTAGRLHNKKALMDELSKIYRVIERELPYADKEVFLVLDATTGMNAVNQARLFGEAASVTGIVLTKLDGTAKGGVVLAIRRELGLPVKFIGVGEGVEDLRPFDAQTFARGLFEE
ncbi:MAG: signal recognition particle-docking protein FtsY [Oscillospiraceae bacterium]|jgi:fused signal recognition particle receptor|nr:signal recognition particle-docking protein FtsY [Oscillospiraceae bacterium]